MQISKHSVVSIHYTLRNDAGEELDSSVGGQPLNYIQGMGNLISGLEEALEGRQAGEKLNVTVPAEKAYGEREDQLVQQVPLTAFGGVENIEPGMRFHAETDHGPHVVVVLEVDDEHVVVDGNHPLAGETLHFEVEITEVREASQDELSHGHVHGPGCDH
ncbi:peptidylprolyl isomerase [Pokkaliibacter plantistimulans]|uniref:Peptidyl-prolyl cis-trans isomerase n=1 Tax=Pokkaliibacter plantistimulans TaxID=1635171 RepID=A0ABX5LRB1_9GAMM|nr:peptidylprolyl isomerase [Pokkaliibacter plantistimulans]PXF29199.1 peptidylprolyl isomerase [Pokkaliibacter plantistimulans]